MITSTITRVHRALVLHLVSKADYSADCIMRFSFGRYAAILAGVAGMVVCSCEKHHVGEIPEVQKEQVDSGTASEENPAKATEGSTSPTPPAAPTPAEFFSPAKP